MSYAPDGRLLSPGEVYEAAPVQVKEDEWQEDLNVALICPDCKENPPNLVEEFSAGDTICGSCGRVLADRIIDTRSEWRTFSNDGKWRPLTCISEAHANIVCLQTKVTMIHHVLVTLPTPFCTAPSFRLRSVLVTVA